MRATGLDHIVLNVADARRSMAWYQEHLGLQPLRVEEWERGEAPFVSLRVDGATIIDLLEAERTGENMAHLCLVVDADLDAVAAAGQLTVLMGPADLFGARGIGRGLYVEDPDGNVVELRAYAPD